MAIPISRLYGVPPELNAGLKALGIRRTDELLEKCRTGEDRTRLALGLEVEVFVVQQLAHRADLSRIRGVGGVYLSLLEAAGVHSMADLAIRETGELRDQLVLTGRGKDLIDRIPSQSMVAGWVAKANSLPRCLEP